MEPRPATGYKENVPPKTVAVLRPELKRPCRNLDVSLGSGGQRMPVCQVTTHSQGPGLCQKPYQVQSNMASPRPRLTLALKDTVARLGDTGLWQQSNLQLPVGRSQRRTREPFVQQSNLGFRGTISPHQQNSCLPPTGPSCHQMQTLQVADALCLDLRLSGGLASLDGCTWPGPRPWCSSGSWAPRIVGEPLTLEDLSVSAHSRSQASSPSSCSTAYWLLDSIQHLEPETTCLGSQTSWEHPGLTQRGPPKPTPAQPWPSHSRESISFLETLGVQARFSESPIYKPLSREATLGTLAGDFSDSDQEVLSTQHLGAGERGPPGLLCNKRHRGHFSVTRKMESKETRLESTAVFSVLSGQAGREKAPQEKTGRDKERMASCLSNTALAQSTLQNEDQNTVTLDSQATCWKLLSKSFRAWRHLSQRHQAVATATAMSPGQRHGQLIRKNLRELCWVLWLQEAPLEAAREQQAKALLARSFREWRRVALQQKLEQPRTQAATTFLASRGSLFLERKAVSDLAWRCRCFKAWQRFVQRGAQYRRHLACRRVRTLKVCLGQWMEMMRLQASDVTKVTQLALSWQKAGNEVLSALVPGAAMPHCLETVARAQQLSKGSDQRSLWEICQKSALYRTLLLWRTRFYQHQQALTHRVQSQSTLSRQKLEPQTQAQGVDSGHWLRLDSRGCLLLLMDTPETHWPPVIEGVLPSLTWPPVRGTQRTTSWALSDTERPFCPALQFWLPLPAALHWPPTGLAETMAPGTGMDGGHGGKRSFSSGWLHSYTREKIAGSFPRPFEEWHQCLRLELAAACAPGIR